MPSIRTHTTSAGSLAVLPDQSHDGAQCRDSRRINLVKPARNRNPVVGERHSHRGRPAHREGAIIALVNPAMLASPHSEINGAVHIYAGYLAARNIALAFALTALLLLRARRALGNLLALVALIQLLDVGMDCVEGRWMVAPGVFALGVICLLASTRLSGPFWRRDAWMG